MTVIGNVHFGARVPDATEFERIFGGVVSVGTVFANAIYCISEILSEKSQVFDHVLYVPVYATTPVAKVLSVSASSISGAVSPGATDVLGYEISIIPTSPFFSWNCHTRPMRSNQNGESTPVNDAICHASCAQIIIL